MINRRLLVLALATVLSGLAVSARAAGRPFNFSAEGALQPSPYVFPDGNPAVYITDQGTSDFGPITVYEWIAAVADGKSCTPPSGVAGAGSERVFRDALILIRFESTGDLLFGNLISGSECVDLSSGAAPFQFQAALDLSVTGGTGSFAGATGTISETSSGQLLSCTEAQGPCLGYGMKAGRGTLKLQ